MNNKYYKHIQERMTAYTETARGKRFLRSMELSKEFLYTHEKSGNGLGCEQVGYLADKATNGEPITALFDMYALAYRIGYKTARKKAKEKKN